jgi:predicted pyridoxine 5'-phosphate oxidase superfamily flavin-nucleotide-binding protein
MTIPTSDVAFTPAVKAIQAERGSRQAYERLEARGGWQRTVTPDFVAFLAERDSFYFGTANAAGQPYIQHRGGPKGFLRVLDEQTLGFADFRGNKQYITLGNLAENDRAFIFLMDYEHQARVKIWGRARVVENDSALLARLKVGGYDGKPEQAILFTIEAWDGNCRQHIPQLVAAYDVANVIEALKQRLIALEADNAELRRRLGQERARA